jgi:transcriptional regulator GlxA family with amidase domain
MPNIGFWVYDDILASGVVGPIDVLTAANRICARRGRTANRCKQSEFKWRIESLDGKPVRTRSGQFIHVDGRIDAATTADCVFLTAPFVDDIGRFLDERHAILQPLFAGLRSQHERGTLLGTYCTGTYLFAQAGLLDGRIATTHWASAKDFQNRYPQVNLCASHVLTEEDRIICGGAVTSYLNLTLRMVAELIDEELAAATARFLLIDTSRDTQLPYVSFEVGEGLDHSDPLVAKAQRWMRKHFGESIRLPDLARQFGTSERTLNRRFKAATGEPPLRYLQSVRIEAAKASLETRRLSVDSVCQQVGYDDVSTFRQLFKREVGLSPHDYQRLWGNNLGKNGASIRMKRDERTR